VTLLTSILAAESNAAGSVADALIPVSPGWIAGFLLLILWLVVAAIILGPLIRHFQLEPKSAQFFTGDRPIGGPRRH
jgi:hypothetical protein